MTIDVMMPRLDGFDTVERLRADPRTADLKIAMVTACAQADDLRGATRSASTPTSPSRSTPATLVRTVRDLVAAARPPDPARSVALSRVTPAELSDRRPGRRAGGRRRGRPGRRRCPARGQGRAAQGQRARRLRDQRRPAARQAGRPAAARGRRGRRHAAARDRRGRRGRRRRPRLPQHHPRRRRRRASWPRTVVAAGDGLRRTATAWPGSASTSSSSRPTRPGPLHLGHVRWAAVGDALARVLQAAGADVDARVLLQRRGRADRPVRAVAARRAPRASRRRRTGTRGAYIDEIAAQVVAQQPDVLDLADDERAGDAFRGGGRAT